MAFISDGERWQVMVTKPSYKELEQKIGTLETEGASNRRFLQDLINHFPDLIFVKDETHRYILLNDAFCAAMGATREALLGRTDYDVYPREQADVFRAMDRQVMETGESNVNEELLSVAGGGVRTVLTRKVVFRGGGGRKLILGIAHDITERKKMEAEREKLIRELRTALAEIKTLRGFLPICVNCKKIRDDRGYWNQLETYFSKYSQLSFTHGICPDCTRELYPEVPCDEAGDSTPSGEYQ